MGDSWFAPQEVVHEETERDVARDEPGEGTLDCALSDTTRYGLECAINHHSRDLTSDHQRAKCVVGWEDLGRVR